MKILRPLSLYPLFPDTRPRRNFIRENVQLIRARSVSMTRLPSVQSSTASRSGPPKRLNPVKTLRTSESCNFCQHSAKSTDSASQTIDVNDEYFLKDAIIRFPRTSAKDQMRGACEMSPTNEHSTQTDAVHPQPNELEGLNTNIAELTLSRPEIPATALTEQHPKTTSHLDTNKKTGNKLEPHHKVGEVPKYLIQRKKDIAHAQAMIDNDTPIGHYLLTEEERLEAVHLAQSRYNFLIQQLNAIPITSQTFRTRTKKIEIEKELQGIENTLKIFSRNKVFVNLGE